MKKVAIVGYGRFGKTLQRLFGTDFEVGIFHHDSSPSEIFNFSKTIFYSVPIHSFESIIKKHRSYINGHLLIDTLSVKEHPKKIFSRYLKNTNGHSLLAHPMFGPDSSKDGFADLPIVLDKNTASTEEYMFWKSYFVKKHLNIVEMSAQEHDKLAASSQGLTHFIARLLEQLGFRKTAIDSSATKKLLGLMELICHDDWRLFYDLQSYNHYTKRERIKLGKAYDKLYNQLLPKRISKKWTIYGIQGGKGSFNEEAIMEYFKKNRIKKHRIKYLYTTEKVLRSLHEGSVDYGLFAIENSTGGVVSESVQAMANYRFKIIKELDFPVRHFLMKKKDINISDIKKIIAHPQGFAQCKHTLAKKYPHLIQESGKGDYIDTARAAMGLANGKIPNYFTVLGPRFLSTLFDLEIIDEDLQDNKNNLTTFFMVKRNTT